MPRPATWSISRRVRPWQFLTVESPILSMTVPPFDRRLSQGYPDGPGCDTLFSPRCRARLVFPWHARGVRIHISSELASRRACPGRFIPPARRARFGGPSGQGAGMSPVFTVTYWGITGTLPTPLRPAEVTDRLVAAVRHLLADGGLHALPRHATPEAVRALVLERLPFP